MIIGAIFRFILAFWVISILGLITAVAVSMAGYRLARFRARRSRPEQISSRAQRRATTAAFRKITSAAADPATQGGSGDLARMGWDEGADA